MTKVANGVDCRNIATNVNCLSSVHERYRQTDNRHAEGRVDLLVLILYISICTIYNVYVPHGTISALRLNVTLKVRTWWVVGETPSEGILAFLC